MKKQSTAQVPRDELRIYFRLSQGGAPWPHISRDQVESYFNLDWRGCSVIGNAWEGYVTSAADLHRFAGHETVVFDVPLKAFNDWHEQLHSRFMPKAGGYSIDDICQAIGEGSRKLVLARAPDALMSRFSPDTDLDRWFAGSQITEPSSAPLLLFRAVVDGSNPGNALPENGPIWLAADGAWATRVGDGADLAEAVVCIKKPYEVPAGLSYDEMISNPIPDGFDGLIVRNCDGCIEAAAVASIEQICFAGAAGPVVESWYGSWISVEPDGLKLPYECAAIANEITSSPAEEVGR